MATGSMDVPCDSTHLSHKTAEEVRVALDRFTRAYSQGNWSMFTQVRELGSEQGYGGGIAVFLHISWHEHVDDRSVMTQEELDKQFDRFIDMFEAFVFGSLGSRMSIWNASYRGPQLEERTPRARVARG